MTTPFEADVGFKNQRRAAISQHPTQIGIDYVTVQPLLRQSGLATMLPHWELWLYFIPAAQPPKALLPAPLPEPGQIRITGLTPLVNTNIVVESVRAQGDEALVVTMRYGSAAAQGVSDLPTYVLTLDGVAHLDPFFNHVTFSLAIDSPSQFESSLPQRDTAPVPAAPDINYLAKDFASFRQLMLNRLSVTMPQWEETSPADLGQVLVDILAYAADQLSYYQDAVATEAYLGTARQRMSVRRHARLLDYAIREGCNARTWVQIQLAAQVPGPVSLPCSVQLLAGAGDKIVLHPNTPEHLQALHQGATVFETMHAVTLYQAHNTIDVYTWGACDFSLPTGATQATLVNRQGQLHFTVGDVLCFEQVKQADTGARLDKKSRTLQHVVRLTQVAPTQDPLGGRFLQPMSDNPVQLLDIAWGPADALPFVLMVSAQIGNTTHGQLSVARGNMVLADHGCTIAGELLDPPEVPDIGPYRPRLQQSNLTYCVPYDHDLARQQPAAVATRQDSNAALPVISLTQVTDSSPWTAQSDLLDSDADATVFVVEMDNDRRASLRFGDGTFGRQPPGNSQFLARYRVGNGLAGNIGRETITHIVHASDDSFAAVRNLLPAHGGAEPESLAHVRSNAPYALHTQERCVIEADYAAVAARHPEVKKARAFRKWTGSWETTFLALDRRDNKPVDDDFRRTLLAFMQPYLLAGADLEIRPPLFVPLDLALTVTVAPNHFPSTVKQRLLETFSNVDLPSGQRGFFHPDNLSFGQPIYLSQIVASAAQIAGVMRVDVARFQRWSQPARGELQQGVIPIAPIEIARLDNNPNAPEYGALSLTIGTSSQGPQSP